MSESIILCGKTAQGVAVVFKVDALGQLVLA